LFLLRPPISGISTDALKTLPCISKGFRGSVPWPIVSGRAVGSPLPILVGRGRVASGASVAMVFLAPRAGERSEALEKPKTEKPKQERQNTLTAVPGFGCRVGGGRPSLRRSRFPPLLCRARGTAALAATSREEKSTDKTSSRGGLQGWVGPAPDPYQGKTLGRSRGSGGLAQRQAIPRKDLNAFVPLVSAWPRARPIPRKDLSTSSRLQVAWPSARPYLGKTSGLPSSLGRG